VRVEAHINYYKLIATAAAAAIVVHLEEQYNKRGGRSSSRIRQRRSVNQVNESLGRIYFRRMTNRSFWVLHYKLKQEINSVNKRSKSKLLDHDNPPLVLLCVDMYPLTVRHTLLSSMLVVTQLSIPLYALSGPFSPFVNVNVFAVVVCDCVCCCVSDSSS
jgi:hypothetical protein